MKELRLPLKKKWFDMTKEGIKREDYIKITPYWMSRLLLFQGKKMGARFWASLFLGGDYEMTLRVFVYDISPAEIDVNTMTLGYPKRGDKERELRYKHEGIETREGNPEWRAEKGKVYFVIKHGEEYYEKTNEQKQL